MARTRMTGRTPRRRAVSLRGEDDDNDDDTCRRRSAVEVARSRWRRRPHPRPSAEDIIDMVNGRGVDILSKLFPRHSRTLWSS